MRSRHRIRGVFLLRAEAARCRARAPPLIDRRSVVQRFRSGLVMPLSPAGPASVPFGSFGGDDAWDLGALIGRELRVDLRPQVANQLNLVSGVRLGERDQAGV